MVRECLKTYFLQTPTQISGPLANIWRTWCFISVLYRQKNRFHIDVYAKNTFCLAHSLNYCWLVTQDLQIWWGTVYFVRLFQQLYNPQVLPIFKLWLKKFPLQNLYLHYQKKHVGWAIKKIKIISRKRKGKLDFKLNNTFYCTGTNVYWHIDKIALKDYIYRGR